MISVVLHDGPGLADYTFHLANALSEVARVGWSVAAAERDRFGGALSSRVMPLVYRRPRRRQLWGVLEMRRQAQVIREFKPDLFHLQADGLWESVLLRYLGALPVIDTVHDPVKHIDQRNWLNNALMQDAVSRASGWVVHGEGLKRVLLDHFRVDEKRVLIHPHGLLNYYAQFECEGAQREKTILFYGAFRHNKGGDILLQAFDAVQGRMNGWKLVMAGQDDKWKVPEAIKNKLGDRLDYRGRFISDRETANLFSRAGIVALPYRHGTQSGVLAIAAAFGCPVLATRVGNMPEIMQDRRHVFFVQPDDEIDLEQGIQTLAQDDALRNSLGKNLQMLAETDWSWRSIAQVTISFYEKILQAK